jgi:hypothetical protein
MDEGVVYAVTEHAARRWCERAKWKAYDYHSAAAKIRELLEKAEEVELNYLGAAQRTAAGKYDRPVYMKYNNWVFIVDPRNMLVLTVYATHSKKFRKSEERTRGNRKGKRPGGTPARRW